MLFISILATVWFVVWLYVTWQKYTMEQVATCILIDFSEKYLEEKKEED